MSPGIIVLVSAVVIGVALSVLKSRFDGRFRGTRAVRRSGEKEAVEATSTTADRIVAADLGTELGDRATMLQFSSAFCAPCRATRRTLAEVEAMVEGVRHIELDAESRLELVRRLDIMRTPTVLVLDATGAIVTRASGQPRKADVIAALGVAVDAASPADRQLPRMAEWPTHT
ncbi:TlpA family protein disulfide reductase [Kribbella catacumbae]|uniref:TlpA family protein disulfide reductase n=1 Tax=Kribbella catacumbae TaxID=460086 RepID=UPI000376714B|nr:thioredoxin family protein [Kribbella catacumbae]